MISWLPKGMGKSSEEASGFTISLFWKSVSTNTACRAKTTIGTLTFAAMDRCPTVGLDWASSEPSRGSVASSTSEKRSLFPDYFTVCILERKSFMLISLEDVDHVATLARLGLSKDERETLRSQLSSIL